MSPKATSPHEEENRRQVQLDFSTPPPATVAPPKKGKGKSTLETKSKIGGASNSKLEATMKSGKHGGGPAMRETLKRKTTDTDSEAVIASMDQVVESEAKSSKLEGRILRGFTSGNLAA